MEPTSEPALDLRDAAATVDPVAAVRAALVAQVGREAVGDHVGSVDEGQGVRSELFACEEAGYRGWHWSVTAVRVDEDSPMTIDQVVLLPGDEAIVAPAWVPWRERIRPGDLSPGDVLPVEEDDPRLVPAYLSGDPADEFPDEVDRGVYLAAVDELGLGRTRVLSLEGRDAAAQRWHRGTQGPDVPLAQSAPAQCGSCGFLIRIAGPLGQDFGVCANEHANDDGRVVSFQHGCGAHSDAQLRRKHLPAPLPAPVLDEIDDDIEFF